MMQEKMDYLIICARTRMVKVLEGFKNENGDTNLISIIIVLGIVLALVVVFRGYITSILGKIKGSVDSFSNAEF